MRLSLFAALLRGIWWHCTLIKPGLDMITMDFLRFDENGKICEHWDAIQQIPEKSANPNTMYLNGSSKILS